MRSLLLLSGIVLAVLALLQQPASAQDKDRILEDELRLKNALLTTDGPGLTNFLRTRAKGEATAERLKELLEQLGSASPEVRQRACAECIALGAPVVPTLRLASREVDSPQLATLATRLLRILEEDAGQLTASALRLLTARRSPDTADALLEYLPYAENDAVIEELRNALISVAYQQGKADPALIRALSNEHPLRRAMAVTALCSTGNAEPRAVLRKLLSDPSPAVRLQSALALARISDAKAVSTLIALLTELPLEQAREVEGTLNELAGEQAPRVSLGDDADARQKAREAWAKWWLDSERADLLNQLRQRTLSDVDTNTAQSLIDKLGDDSFEVRQQAENQIKALGTRILPLLKQALKNPDLEVRTRAKKLVEAIERDKIAPLSPVTARLIALHKPKGAAKVILAYLPSAEDDGLVEELQKALNVVAFVDGKADPAILEALSDASAVRRSAAGQALCTGPLADHLPAIRRLLQDSDARVRLQVALALASAREPEAIPVLIRLIGELPGELASPAEDYLLKLARETAPKELPDGDDNRKKRSELWAKWYEANKSGLVMVDRNALVLKERYLGYTLLVQPSNSQISELDRDGKIRWTLGGLANPWDVQFLPGNRLLITEAGGQRITERNLKGEILWQVVVPGQPISAERLANGHTFVVCRHLLLQYDRTGREVFKLERPHDIMSARRLPSGQIVVITSNRQLLRLDRAGRELKNVTLPQVMYNQNEILDNGNVIIPLGWNNAIVEYNPEGKEVWRASLPQPMHGSRLPNGNTLIASQNWPYRIYEVTRKGEKVREPLTNTYVFRVRGR
jgi:HEAT repeat protein